MNRNELALLNGVVQLLDIFNVFTTFIQANEYPTMNTFVLFYSEITDRLNNIIDHDMDEIITKAAHILQTNMAHRLPLSIEMIGASLIDPRMQRLPVIQEWLQNNGKFILLLLSFCFSANIRLLHKKFMNLIDFLLK